MSITQGYIVGQPIIGHPDWTTEPPVDSDTAISSAEKDHASDRAVHRPADTVQSLALPAWTDRMSAGGWFRDYLAALRSLARSLPRFAALTVTFRSGMSFFDQVAPVLLLARFYGVRVILRYRSNKADTELDDYARGVLPFLRLCNRIEVACGHLGNAFARYGLKATVVPDRVDSGLFPPRRLTSVQPRIIMARRLIRGNGLAGAIKAFHLVKMKYPRAELIVAGEGPLRPWLEQYVASERIFGVTFTGQINQNEIARLMSQSDVYLNNATIDGLPTSLLEALASGLCVVSTEVGDVPKLIRDGRNGLLVPINNYSALADRIIELVETPPLCAHLSRCAPRTVATLSACPAQRSAPSAVPFIA